jgi:hypothetical protein
MIDINTLQNLFKPMISIACESVSAFENAETDDKQTQNLSPPPPRKFSLFSS